MKRFLGRFIGIGTDGRLPEGLNNSIRISNFVGLLFAAIIGIPMTTITAIFLPPLLMIPVVGTFMFLAVIPFNHTEMNKLSRVILCLAPLSLANIYTSFILDDQTGLSQGLTLIYASFILMPFVLFEWHERGYTITLSIIGLLLLLFQPTYEHLFFLSSEIDISFFDKPIFQIITTTLGITCIGGMMLTLVYRNSVLENKWEKD